MAYTAKDPRPPPTAFSVHNRNILYLRETKLWRCERGGREEKVHLKTHAPLGGGVGKNRNIWDKFPKGEDLTQTQMFVQNILFFL